MAHLRDLTLLALFLSGSLTAQKVCASVNTNNAGSSQQTPITSWIALPFQVTQRTTITACDFRLTTFRRSTRDGTGQVAIWSDNNGRPGSILARAAISVSQGLRGYYGAKFARPIAVQSGTYWIALRNTGGIDVVLGGSATPYWIGPPFWPNWNRASARVGWSYRVYCGTHGGGFASYGMGKPGSGAVSPRLRGLGQPNTTNTVHLQLSRGLGSAPGILVWGTRTSVVFSLGTLYATPAVPMPIVLRGTGAGLGHFTQELLLPNDAALKGGKLALQCWIADSGAANGWAHTAGLEMTIGH